MTTHLLSGDRFSGEPGSFARASGVDRVAPGGCLDDLLELALKGTPVSLRRRLQPGNDIDLEITDKNLCHSGYTSLVLVK